jgi:hypothetical protein
VHQGGAMNETEATNFENHEMFTALLKIRSWDDLAKDTELNLAANATSLMTRYKNMLSDLLQ